MNNGSNIRLIVTLILIGLAGFAFLSGNTLAAVLVFVGYILGAINVLASRAAAPPTPERLEALGNILKRLSEEDYARIAATAGGGRKIEAIKALRAATGAGLKDSREAVELILAHGESTENA